jgi:hypothetical protein
MKTRMIGALVVAVAMAVLATGASAAKPKLWLTELMGFGRVGPGTGATVRFSLEGTCPFSQKATLASNGKPSDKLSPTPGEHLEECVGGKIAGGISGVAMAAAPGGLEAMTVKSKLEVFVAPWCIYGLPKTIALAPSNTTSAETTVTSALEAPASHGSCPASVTDHLEVSVIDPANGVPFYVEVE